MLCVGAFIILLLLWTLRRYVSRPLSQLVDSSQRIADGELDIELEVQGKGEIARLGHAMQHMSARIHDMVSSLRESEQRQSITLDSIGDAVLVTDQQGLITRMNSIAEQLTGRSMAEALGHPVIEVFHIVNAETREPAEHPVGRVLREGWVVGLANHTTLISRDGSKYQIADSAAPICGDEGNTLGVIMVFQDVTERYAMESEIKGVRHYLQAILDSLPDPCFLLSADGQYLDVLGGPEELLAQNREFLLGRQIADILAPEQAAPIMRTIEETIHTRQVQRLEYEVDTISGRRLFEGTAAPVEHDGTTAVVWLARDYTARRQAEEQLEHLARYDQLTGLANRVMTLQHLEQLSRIFHPLLAFPGGQWMEDVVPRTGRGKAREGLFSRLQAHLPLTPLFVNVPGQHSPEVILAPVAQPRRRTGVDKGKRLREGAGFAGYCARRSRQL